MFKKIKKQTIEGFTVYSAEVNRDELTLQTVWWYDNGSIQTTEEWEWRWRSLLYGEKYYLINITVLDQETDALQKLITEFRHAGHAPKQYSCPL